MRAPRFLHGAGLGLALAFCAAALFAVLSPIFATSMLLRALIASIGLAYVLYLIGRSGERTGRVTTVGLWLAVTALSWVTAPLPLYLLIHVGMIWLIRSLYYYSGVAPALMDLGLSGLALAAAVYAATRTGSLFIAVWCFFLVQALAAAIPASLRQRSAADAAAEVPPFERAQRHAEAALRRLSTTVDGGSRP